MSAPADLQAVSNKQLSDAALWYAERLDWAVLPLHTPDSKGGCSCGVAGCRSAGKHPRIDNGVHGASKDKAQILEWWGMWPDANIGLAAGASHVAVIDVDPRNGGDASLRKLKQRDSIFDKALTAETGGDGGGLHVFFDGEDDATLPAKLGPEYTGIDLQADNRIVVLAPSLHASGRRYKWRTKPRAGEPLPRLPQWLRDENPRRSAKRPNVLLHEGERNDGLTSVGGRWRNTGMEEPELVAALLSYNDRWCDPSLDQREVQRIARSLTRYEPAGERYEYSDIGNGERMLAQHGADIRITKGHGVLVWDGRRWAGAGPGELKRRAIETVKRIMDEKQGLSDDKEIKALEAHYKRSASRHAIESMITVFSASSMVDVDDAKLFDAHPNLFNCLNGTLDVSGAKVKLRPHRREDYLTALSPVVFDPEARCPRIDAWLKDIQPPEIVTILYELLGLLLVDEWRFKTAAVLLGPSDTGKSTFLRLIEALLGKEVVWNASLQDICNNKFTAADLLGKRANICADLPDSYLTESAIFKQLTGGDDVKAERKHGHPFTFRNQARLIFSANKMPKARDKTTAFTNRWLILPFTKVIPKEKQHSGFEDGLREEVSGLLNRGIAGLVRLRRQGGFSKAEAVDRARSDYRAELNPLLRYFEEYVKVAPRSRVAKRALYMHWLQIPDRRGSLLSSTEFNRQIKEHFGSAVGERKIKGERMWAGLQIR